MKKHTPELVVVTGAGSGIGRATALRFAAGGAMVIVGDLNEASADETVDLVTAAGGRAVAYQLDVSKAASMEAFAAEINRDFGVADVVVNNAGFTTAGSFFDHSAADWDRLMGVNVYGVIHGCRLFAKQMVLRGRGGQIINVASGAAYVPIPLSSPYCATKTAVLMLSECLRVELAGEGIGVTAICPGAIDTAFYRAAQPIGMGTEEGERFKALSGGAVSKVGSTPDVVAKAIVRASRTNPAIQPVTLESHLGYALSRISPAALRLAAGFAVIDRAQAVFDRYVPDRLQGATTRAAGQ